MPAVDLASLAAAIADAKPIDWGQFSPEDVAPDLAARARIVERIANLHAGLPTADTFSSSLHKSLLNLSDEEIAASETPITWGPLVIGEKIGQGTYGHVFRARDRRLNRDVALKLLRRKDRRESAVIEEGHLMARVRHPNVVTVYGAERIDGRVGLWMEYVDGQTLEEELRTRGPFAADEIVKIGIQLCEALSAVHRAGLLHRDLKAQNVMRDRDGRVLLTDFGASRELVDGHHGAVDLAGTPLYLAPEVLLGEPASAPSDIYSLGVLLYRLSTGGFPVNGGTIAELREAHATRQCGSIADRRIDLPVRLAAAIDRAIASNPASRFAAAGDLREALANVTRRRHRYVNTAAAVAVTAGIVVTAYPSIRSGHRANVELTQLTFNSVEVPVTVAAISPDAKHLAYADESGLVLRTLSSGQQRRIPLSSDVVVQNIGWLRDSNGLMLAGSGGLWRTSMGGEPPRRIGDGGPIAVSPDGSRVAVTNLLTRRIDIVTTNGEFLAQVVSTEPGSRVSRSAWSPDGQRIAYTRQWQTPTGVRMALETRRTDGTDPTVVVPEAHIHDFVWAPDGRILFSRPQPPPKARYANLWAVRVDATSGRALDEPTQITHLADINFNKPSITGDGSRLVFTVNRHALDVHVADFDARRLEMNGLRRAVFSTTDKWPASWTPQGDAILFQQSDEGKFGIYRQALDEIEARAFLLRPDASVTQAVFSPDANWIYYMTTRDRRLMRVSAGGGAPEPIALDVGATNVWLACSRLPANVCVVSAVSGGRLRLTVFNASQPEQRSHLTLPAPPVAESWDLHGTQVVSLTSAESATRLLVLDLTIGQLANEIDVPPGSQSVAWAADGKGWIVTRALGARGSEVFFVDSAGNAKTVWRSGFQRLWRPIVSPDGRRVAFASGTIEMSVWMLRGF